MIDNSNDMAGIVHIHAPNAKCDAFEELKLKALVTNSNVLYKFAAIDSALTLAFKLPRNLLPI